MNNRDRFIIQGRLSDGRPGYWHPANGGEWRADLERARVFKLRAVAERVVDDYGGILVPLTRPQTPQERVADLERTLHEIGALVTPATASVETVKRVHMLIGGALGPAEYAKHRDDATPPLCLICGGLHF